MRNIFFIVLFCINSFAQGNNNHPSLIITDSFVKSFSMYDIQPVAELDSIYYNWGETYIDTSAIEGASIVELDYMLSNCDDKTQGIISINPTINRCWFCNDGAWGVVNNIGYSLEDIISIAQDTSFVINRKRDIVVNRSIRQFMAGPDSIVYIAFDNPVVIINRNTPE